MGYLDELNPQQHEAVTNTEGPCMVIAGAGSGKTRVLTYRIAHLIEKGVDPFSILSLTFTNKAAKEMKERIGKVIGGTESRNIWMGTFHSVFARILRSEAHHIGYPQNFTIYDTQDSKNLIKSIVKEFGLDDKLYKVGIVYNRISSAKNNLISAQNYLQNAELMGDDRSTGRPKIGEIYKTYASRCFRAGAMDFDDLLFKTNVLFRDHLDVLYKYQHRFKYLLVDEYQDTNYSQYLIVKKLAAANENLVVVGDDAQSIYAFRGANIQNILNFKKDYPDYKLYKLEQNYRSTKMIVQAANSVIKKNKDQIEKNVWTDNASGDKIKVVRTLSDNEEGFATANSIFDTIQNENATYRDFAILYRTNAQSRSFEESLRRLNIPYKIFGGLSFYQRKEIKDLLSYYRLVANHNDEEAFKRVINYPKRGIGKTSIEALIVAANEEDKSLWDIASNLHEIDIKINNGTKTKIQEFCTMIKSFTVQLDTENAYELGKEIATSTGITRDLHADKSPEGVSRYDNIQELLNGLKEFSVQNESEETQPTLSDFLIDVALLTNADNEKEEDNNKVVMMTIHSAKGLEFPYVYIVGLEENLFPSQMSLTTRDDLEEERRLFYVAITRAEKKATLSYATSRYKWGNLTSCEPSRFIEEISPEFLEAPELVTPKKREESLKKGFEMKFNKPQAGLKNLKKVSTTPTSSGGSDNKNIVVGVNVKHAKFGKGKIVNIEGVYPNRKATVFFPNVGQKQLLLKFAKLELLD
ncbi:UvrD-helicase domain-containing protein [Flavobacteriales bacterium]|nr:UvrD-helicase domain-containing protein [Flavobacteriales bacterium]